MTIYKKREVLNGGPMKQQLIERLLELTKQQSKALQEENIEAFGNLLNARQEIMDQITALEAAHPEVKEEKCEELVKELIALDAQNATEYKRQFEEVKQKLQDTRGQISQMRQRQHVSNIYNNPYDLSQEEGIFFDKK